MIAAGVSEEIAVNMSNLGPLTAAPDIVLVAGRTGRSIGDVAATYFAAGSFFGLDRIVAAAGNIPIADYFDRLALDRARDSIGDAERRLTAAMIGDGEGGAAAVERWVASRKAAGRTDSQAPSTKLPHLGLHCPSLQLPQVYWGIWSRIDVRRRTKKGPQAVTRLGSL